MAKNGSGCQNVRNSLVAATFEKENTYVFAAPIIRDREVGGSNPLAPTNNSHSINYIRSRAYTLFFPPVANLWTKLFDYEINQDYLCHHLQKPPKRES